jgi:adenosylcobinamide kinase/adenosylcobinamide-phosphate guanylyltransferase
MARVMFITGGARSGKSAYALTLAVESCAPPRYFIATAEAFDDEMRDRIAHHRAQRSNDYVTIEAPRAVAQAIAEVDRRGAGVAVIDCLTLWISNLLSDGLDDAAIMRAADELGAAIAGAKPRIIVVSGEVGAGIVPANPLARRFRDLLGWTNQIIARAADEAFLMAAGYPIRLK